MRGQQIVKMDPSELHWRKSSRSNESGDNCIELDGVVKSVAIRDSENPNGPKIIDTLYPEHRGDFARVITHDASYAQDLIDKFSMKDSPPHIAVSVDMLDTGIDIPEVVNLVFAKLVRSKTKFWQMIGRGTRLCPDLFGPNIDKQKFLVFDLCRNVEFFNQNIATAEGRVQPSLSAGLDQVPET